MIKYLLKKHLTYWYRRKVKNFGEIVFSLKTKNYDIAVIRHSYIDHQIKKLIHKGLFETMNASEIKELIDKYKQYMLTVDYNEFEEQRDKELSITVNGVFYGGHTAKALNHAVERYRNIHAQNDIDSVKQETEKILSRSNLQEEYKKLSTDKERTIFHWELLKAEMGILHKTYLEQKKLFTEEDKNETSYLGHSMEALMGMLQEKHQKDMQEVQNSTVNSMSITELLQRYIRENQEAKEWSDKNGRDLEYVLGHLASYYNDKDISELTRENFSQFRDMVLRNLPKSSQTKELQDKSTLKVIECVKNKKLDTIGLITINKHLRRLHQVFEWASNCGYIEKNLTKDLKLVDKKKSKKKKTAKIPYSKENLVKLFNDSPWYNEELGKILKYKPQNVFIPLIAIFCGAKPVELGTLKLSAIKKQHGIWGIDFDQMIKTTDSERFTPLSRTLLDIGFLKYVQYQKKQKETLLFPTIKVYKGGGVNFTNDFTQYNRKYITQEKDKSFYSIRHLVNQMFKNKKVHSYIVNDIIGHSQNAHNLDDSVYGDGQMPEKILRDTINECLIYDFLDFSKIKQAIEERYK